MNNTVNLFWIIEWSAVLVGCIFSLFCRPVLYAVIFVAAINAALYLKEYIRIKKMK